jgi:TPP-dependent pyruvate/acetoin dehydrogenase alpha subunit
MAMQDPDSATLLEIYRRVALIRRNDHRTIKELKAGRLAIPYYSPRGQEMIPAAISVLLRADDYVCTVYRGIHDMLAKGLPLKQLWAEISGKATGACKGKGGPMHLTCPPVGLMVTTGIVGSSMPIANGLAWAAMLDGSDRVAVANFGDGASNIGAFHEALNLASVWKLPTIFVCQNNRYAEHTAYGKATATARIADRAASYQMPGIHVDGNNPVEMYRAARTAIERARSGGGPTLIEAMTFRFMGHVVGDDDAYMDKAVKRAALENDPVPRFREKLLADGIADEATLVEIETAIDTALDEAVEFAAASPYPELGELAIDVYDAEVLV